MTKDVFYADDNLVGVNKGVMHVTEISTGNKMTITCDEYSKNKEKYKHTFSGISAYDTVLHKNAQLVKKILMELDTSELKHLPKKENVIVMFVDYK